MSLEHSKDEFFKKHGITNEKFEQSGITWAELDAILADHGSCRGSMVRQANSIAEILREAPDVHSIRVRVKDDWHLAEKIIRKRAADPIRIITRDNYKEEVTDLIGVRALHLHKNQWPAIHDYICDTWEVLEKTANVREGDPEEWVELCQSKGCTIDPRKAYRSVHYILRCHPTLRESFIVELQVRTIFEEAWGEIDHTMNYPLPASNELLKRVLLILNRIAGLGDELGSFSFDLLGAFSEQEKSLKLMEENAKQAQENAQAERSQMLALKNEYDQTVKNLEKIVAESEASSSEKADMQTQIENLQGQLQAIQAKNRQLDRIVHPERDWIEEYRKSMEVLNKALVSVLVFDRSTYSKTEQLISECMKSLITRPLPETNFKKVSTKVEDSYTSTPLALPPAKEVVSSEADSPESRSSKSTPIEAELAKTESIEAQASNPQKTINRKRGKRRNKRTKPNTEQPNSAET